MDFITIGEMVIDFIPGQEEASYIRNAGGAPANVAIAAARNGLESGIYCKVGEDDFGRFLLKTLRDNGVTPLAPEMAKDAITTMAFVSLDENNDRSFTFARKPGADTQLRPEEVKEEIVKNTKIFHCGSLSLTDEPARSATFHAVKMAKEAGALISYDPNYRAPLWNSVEEAKEQMRSMIPYADIMKISDEETALLTDYSDPKEAAQALLDQGVACVVVTLGKDGALLKTAQVEIVEKGKERKVVDTTGAGDSFWGGILSRFAKDGISPAEITEEKAREYVRFANAVAGLCVEKRGAIPAMPTLEQVLAEL